mgnify:FL=1
MEFVNDTDTVGKHHSGNLTISLPHIKRDIFYIFSFLERDLIEIIHEIAYTSGRQDINDFLVSIIEQDTDIVRVPAFECIGLIEA